MTRWIVVSDAGPASPSRPVRNGARRVIENVRDRLAQLQGDRPGNADRALQPAPETGLEAEPQAWCSIVLAQTQDRAEFHAVVLEAGGGRRLVARSEPFRVSRRWAAGARGAPRKEHDALVARLEALGWQRIPTAGRWHDTALVLQATAPPPATRSATPHRTPAKHNAGAARTLREPDAESAVRPKRAGKRSPAPKREASQSSARMAPATGASAQSGARMAPATGASAQSGARMAPATGASAQSGARMAPATGASAQSGARMAPATGASAQSGASEVQATGASTPDPTPRKTRRATDGPAALSALQPTVYIDAPQEPGRASADETSGAAQDVPRHSAKRASDPFRFRVHAERHQAPRRK